MAARAVSRAKAVSRWRAGRSQPRPGSEGFGATPGALLAVCGLHGGAGTTTVTASLAVAAAGISPQEAVLAVEADARAGELEDRLGVASPCSLEALAELASAGRRPDAPFATRVDGLRVIASEPSAVDRRAVDIALVLAEARRVHGLVVVDAGAICGDAASACLTSADIVLWTARAERLELAAQRLSGPLVRDARGGRWLLAISGGRASRGALSDVREVLAARVTLPADLGQRPAAVEQLLDVVRSVVP